MTTQQITTPSPLGPWTDAENDILATEYSDMLTKETRGEKYNKAATRRGGLAAMAATRDDSRSRSHGSWEMKSSNLSAVLRAAGLPWINGYKPLGHGQMKPLAAAMVRHALAIGWDDTDVRALEKAHKL